MWVTRDIGAPAETCWDLLVDVGAWPSWGPSVAAARLDRAGTEASRQEQRIRPGDTGAVRAPVGPWIPFRITEVEEGYHWSWRVAGVPATSHRVEGLGRDRCRVGFEVPTLAAPYALVCALALRRIEKLAAT